MGNTPCIHFSSSGFTAVFNLLVPFSVCYNSALVISKHHFLRKENNGKDSTVNTVKTIAKPASDLYLRRVCFGGFDLYILYLVKNLFRDSSVFVIELAVVLVYLPRDAAGIAVSHDIRRNIFRHDAARADNAVVPYRHAGHYQSPTRLSSSFRRYAQAC